MVLPEGIAMCTVFSFFVGISEVHWARAPYGDCAYCCPLRADRDVRYLLYTRNFGGTLGQSAIRRLRLLLPPARRPRYTLPALHQVIVGAGQRIDTVRNLRSLLALRTDLGKRYLLYTRSNPSQAQLLSESDPTSLARSNFDPGAPTVIYLAGFSESVTGPSSTAIRNAYIARGDYNVVLVDWFNLVVFPWYITAVRNTRHVVGACLAEFVTWLAVGGGVALVTYRLSYRYITAVRNTRYMGARLAEFVTWLAVGGGVAPGSLHVIGFSLGAEAAGFAGKRLRRAGTLLGRITGLDPAYPGYSLTDAAGHLARGDAAFVDVLHTNPGVFGFLQPIGDVDFYPNGPGWPVQPGCLPHELLATGRLGQLYGCSHNRSWRLFAESVGTPSGFPATRCRRWRGPLPPCNFTIDGYMGFAAAPPIRGKMYLVTNAAPPFAKNGP